jgi:hypothetical protein
MAFVESFPDVAASDLAATDYFYVRRSAQPSGNRDARFSLSAIVRALFAAADKPTARVALGFLTNTATIDFPSIASQAKNDQTIPVLGAVVGDAVFIGLPAAPAAGLVFNAFVNAPDTVTIRASNTSAGAVDAASATYRVVVVKST